MLIIYYVIGGYNVILIKEKIYRAASGFEIENLYVIITLKILKRYSFQRNCIQKIKDIIRLISLSGMRTEEKLNKEPIVKRRFETRQLTIVGLLSAISVILGLTGYGFIPLPFAKATIMHIPVIIGAIIEGPLVGAAVGLIFGLFSIMQNIMSPNVLSFAFMNPLVSVLPRVLIGITSYYAYAFFKTKRKALRIGFSAVVGTITNTFGVLTMIYFLYAENYAKAMKINVSTAAKAIYGLAFTNGSFEMIFAAAISIPVVMAVKKIRKI